MQEISHFLSVDSSDSLPLTRLEGVKELSRQLHDNKGQIRELLKESDGRVVLHQLQLLESKDTHFFLIKLAPKHKNTSQLFIRMSSQ